MASERSFQRQDRGTRVYVGGLTDEVTKEELETEFERFGKLNSVWVALNPPGFAFVEFAEKEDAIAACDGLNNQELLGSTLRVELSRARRQAGGPRGMRGGRGGAPSFHQSGPRGPFSSNRPYPRSRSPFHSNRGRGGGGGFSRNRNDDGFGRQNFDNSSF